MNRPPFLSIITPTYNREAYLRNCFISLKNQTNSDFEWIVVDDGSTDDTEAAVASFREQMPDMALTYVRKPNGGKHTALNAAHPYIRGQYVLILDSDDTLIETAVQDVYDAWKPFSERQDIGVVVFLKGKSPDAPISYVKQTGVPVDLLRCRRICVYGNDCCEVIRAALFRRFPFPVYPGEKFLSEGVLWKYANQVSRYVYYNKVIYLCDYLEGGLTKSGRAMRINSPLGGMLNSSLNMDRRNSFKERMKNGLLYSCYGYFAGMHASEILAWERHSRILKTLCLLPGYVLYRLWKRKYGK